jgi:hypothetical protein
LEDLGADVPPTSMAEIGKKGLSSVLQSGRQGHVLDPGQRAGDQACCLGVLGDAGFLFLDVLYLQDVHGYSPLHAVAAQVVDGRDDGAAAADLKTDRGRRGRGCRW